jgi:CheY-like chemotaxis protein
MNSLRYLIVEDHDFQRMMLERTVHALDPENVVSVANGAKALRVLGSMPFDVVITDLMMPDVDGIELIPILHKHPPEVGVIFCSVDEASLCAAVAIAEAQGIRILGAIRKPVTLAQLRALLEGTSR